MRIDIRAVTGFLRKNMMIIAACLLPFAVNACVSDNASSQTSQEVSAGAEDTFAVTEADTGTEDNSADQASDTGKTGENGKSAEQEQQAEADKEQDKEPEASGSSEAAGKEAEVKDDWSSAVESSVYVKKVTGLPGDFFTGADMSSYLSEKESGVKYYDFDGNELDDAGFFRFLYENGTNLLRVRVWVDPYDKDGHGYGGGNCDLEHAVKLGKLATDAGMRVLIDFHYSDFWADPGKQRAPKAWENDDLETKCTHLHDYTKESLETLLSGGVDVAMVQVGNETNNGIAGEDDWNDMPKLFAEGVRAIREVSADSGHEIMAAVHFANPEHPGNYRTFAKALEEGGVDYDVFCTSYYPYWHGTLQNLSGILKDISSKYDKKVMVSETSYIYTFEDGDGAGTTETEGKAGDAFPYSVSVQGQADHIRNLAQTMADIGDAAIGICWWEPAWLPVQVVDWQSSDADKTLAENRKIWEEKGSGWATSYAGEYDESAKQYYGGTVVDNEAWFDFYGKPLESARIYNLIRTGATAPFAVTDVDVAQVLVQYGSPIAEVLPETVKVHFNDGTSVDSPVTWDQQEIAVIDSAGDWVITGFFAEEGADITDGIAYCNITVEAENLLQDGGFEGGPNTGYWKVVDENGNDSVAIKKDGDNVRTGSYCLKFWAATDFSFTAEQTVKLNKGTYRFGGYLEGGDCGDSPVLRIEAKVKNGKTYSSDTMVTSWQEWHNPEIDGIEIEEDGTEVTLRVITKAPGGGWGAWDDLYLNEEE